ncbi:DUF58 domain-containing protein [Cellulomonas fimi]|uniref:DUF58 domain-containing protein n=1 Tax=Cellulomonas fimi TaxID=1708 RepID=A0A7Y0LYN9_CELFI|nr:DUF58 domain-containing protein [Cellulomonas fimi]NMR20618.1 DUF58 domain-containing protein [Cellulomonas fimi]
MTPRIRRIRGAGARAARFAALRRLRPTARGWGTGLGGLVLAGLGLGLGSTDLIRLGLVGPLVVLVGAVWLLLVDPTRGRHPLRVVRAVHPNPVPVHGTATARVEVRAGDPSGRARLAELVLGEQAATQLSGGLTLRARVVRSPGQITLSYPIQPIRRGRWPLGPLVVRRADPFGVMRTRAALGQQAEVAVWPEVVDLLLPGGALVGEPDRVALGARTPSPDDAALRDYRVGDDLRRVHWASSARRGQLLVRSDERAGMLPASVLLDLPQDRAGIEWSISLAASMGIALLTAGHPVRLLGARAGEGAATVDPAVRLRHLREGAGQTGRAALLDLTVDLEPGRTPADADADLLAAAHELTAAGSGSALVLGVLGPLSAAARNTLAPVGDLCDALAVVRVPSGAGVARREAEHTIAALRRAGWRACPATPGEDLHTCWLRLLRTER